MELECVAQVHFPAPPPPPPGAGSRDQSPRRGKGAQTTPHPTPQPANVLPNSPELLTSICESNSPPPHEKGGIFVTKPRPGADITGSQRQCNSASTVTLGRGDRNMHRLSREEAGESKASLDTSCTCSTYPLGQGVQITYLSVPSCFVPARWVFTSRLVCAHCVSRRGGGDVRYVQKALERGYLEHPGSACCTDGRFEIFLLFGRCGCCLLPLFVNRQLPCLHTNSHHGLTPVLIRDDKIKWLEFGMTPDPQNLQPIPTALSQDPKNFDYEPPA